MKYIPLKKLNEQQMKAFKAIHHLYFSKIGFGKNELSLDLENNVYEGFCLCTHHKVLGYALYTINNRNILNLNWIAVNQKLKNKGTGTILIKKVIQIAKLKKLKAIELDSRNIFKSAMRLYLRNGFDIVGFYQEKDHHSLIIKFRLPLSK